MIPAWLFLALAALALGATYLWAFKARDESVYLSTGVAYVAWSCIAVLGGSVRTYPGGSTEWVAVDTPAFLQVFALALALLSLLAFMLRHFGAYPPRSAEEIDPASDIDYVTGND